MPSAGSVKNPSHFRRLISELRLVGGRGEWILLMVAAFPIACLLAVLPRGRRFDAARRAAVLFHPYWRWRCRPPRHLDGYQETALYYVCEVASRLRIPFDAIADETGPEALPSFGAVILCPHFLLNRLLLCSLARRGAGASVVVGAGLRVRGFWTQLPLDVLRQDGSILLQVRRRVAAGGTVVIVMDLPEAGGAGRPVETPAGVRYVSDTIMRFAEREGLPLFFSATHMDSAGKITTALTRPTTADAEAAFVEFCRFMQGEAEQVLR
jgi:hypothetical protein